MADVEVRDNETAQHWEAVVGGEVAGFAQYTVEHTVDGDVVTFVHTEVDPRFEGKGVGSALVRDSLDAVRAAGGRIVPQCPFYAAFIERHPEYADLVAGAHPEA